MRKKAVAYVRVSTDWQAEEGAGLEVQEKAISDFCQEEEVDLIAQVFRDEGVSGAKLFEREGLMDMINFLEAAEKNGSIVDYIVVPKLDRLARDVEARGWINFELKRRNIKAKVYSLVKDENREGDSAIVRMMNAMVEYIAEIERERITQRLHDGRMYKRNVKKGYIGGQDPLGYYSPDKSKKLVISDDEKQVEAVRIAFRLKSDGKNLSQIARYLNDNGFYPAKGPEYQFKAQTVKRIFERKDLYYGKLEAPAIIV